MANDNFHPYCIVPEKPLLPTPSWQRPPTDIFRQAAFWGDPEKLYDIAYVEAATEAIAKGLGPNEDPYEFVCRKDPETLVSTEACTTCPFMAGCFGLDLLELEAETRRILEGAL